MIRSKRGRTIPRFFCRRVAVRRARPSGRAAAVLLGACLVLVPLLVRAAPAGETGTDASANVPWEESPYRIRLLIGFDRSPQFSRAARERICRQLATNVRRVVGLPWQLVIEQAPDLLLRGTADELERIASKGVEQRWTGYDKLFFVGVQMQPGRLQIAGREYDAATRHWGPVFEEAACGRLCLSRHVLALCRRMFSPLARLSEREGRQVRMVLKASRLPIMDVNLEWAAPGRPFLPFRRFLDSDGSPTKVEQVPWTLLEVEQADADSLLCNSHSRLRRPFTRRVGGRADIVALGLASTGRPTRVQFVSQQSGLPLVGYEVFLRDPKEDTLLPLAVTDSRGSVEVPAETDGIVHVLLRRGSTLLARVYIVPGHSVETVEVRPGREELAIGARLTALEEELIDTVCRRQVLLRRIDVFLGEEDAERASDALTELRQLGSQPAFERRLGVVREFAVESLGKEPKSLPKNVKARLAALTNLIERYLDPAELGAATTRVRELTLRQRAERSR